MIKPNICHGKKPSVGQWFLQALHNMLLQNQKNTQKLSELDQTSCYGGPHSSSSTSLSSQCPGRMQWRRPMSGRSGGTQRWQLMCNSEAGHQRSNQLNVNIKATLGDGSVKVHWQAVKYLSKTTEMVLWIKTKDSTWTLKWLHTSRGWDSLSWACQRNTVEGGWQLDNPEGAITQLTTPQSPSNVPQVCN